MQTAHISVGRPDTLWPPAIRAELGFAGGPVARTLIGAHRTRMVDAGLSACTAAGGGWRAFAGVCFGAGGGALVTSSFEVDRPAVRARPWFAVFAAPRASVPLTADLSLVIEGRVAFPFVRENLTFYPGITVYEAPALVFQGGIGVEVKLPTTRR